MLKIIGARLLLIAIVLLTLALGLPAQAAIEFGYWYSCGEQVQVTWICSWDPGSGWTCGIGGNYLEILYCYQMVGGVGDCTFGCGSGPTSPPSSSPDPNDQDGNGNLDCVRNTVVTTNPAANVMDSNDAVGDCHNGNNTIRCDHNGVDIQCNRGDRVNSVGDGSVAEVAFNSANGKYIRINHDDGTQSVYLHLESQGVRRGQRVRAGEAIGTCDSTGNSTGDHLHLTVYDQPHPGGSVLDPEVLFNELGNCPGAPSQPGTGTCQCN